MGYRLSAKSKARLDGVHPDLVKVVQRAIDITTIDFCVLEGMRTFGKQRDLFKRGATRTMNSRHLTGHAVDLGAWYQSELRWDWPFYDQISTAMFAAADEMNVSIKWGGHWKSFKDGPHFQLSWSKYPVED